MNYSREHILETLSIEGVSEILILMTHTFDYWIIEMLALLKRLCLSWGDLKTIRQVELILYKR